jgi:DNA-binding transcriptional regulator YiaG
MRDDIRELTSADFARAIPRRVRDRLVRGDFQGGKDVAALRRFTGLSQEAFARALGISVHTLRNWEQGRRMPEGPALALLRIVARHPRVLRENLALAG